MAPLSRIIDGFRVIAQEIRSQTCSICKNLILPIRNSPQICWEAQLSSDCVLTNWKGNNFSNLLFITSFLHIHLLIILYL